jgi:carbon monoxide dehydrogenase subunit G
MISAQSLSNGTRPANQKILNPGGNIMARLEMRITNAVQGVGRAWIDVVQFLGRRSEVPFQLTDWQADRKIAFQSTGRLIPMQGSYSVEPSGGGTQVTFQLTGEPGGFFKLAEPVLMKMLQRQWQTNLANLKDVLEAQA